MLQIHKRSVLKNFEQNELHILIEDQHNRSLPRWKLFVRQSQRLKFWYFCSKVYFWFFFKFVHSKYMMHLNPSKLIFFEINFNCKKRKETEMIMTWKGNGSEKFRLLMSIILYLRLFVTETLHCHTIIVTAAMVYGPLWVRERQRMLMNWPNHIPNWAAQVN